jgi:hypothetical protein
VQGSARSIFEEKTMRLFPIYLIALLIVATSTSFSQSNTVVAVKSGNWVTPETWSCVCFPKRTDSIIIPQGVIVSVTQTIMLGPSETGKDNLVIAIAGNLNISSGSIHIDPADRILLMPGGRVSSKSQGGMIFSGMYALYLDGGTAMRGPATLGRDFSPSVISAITAENETEGVTLSWRSGTQIDVNYYYVLRSFDGINFEKIGKVDGRGSRKQKLYSFIDATHPTGLVHYRIDLSNMNGVDLHAAKLEVAVTAAEGSVTVAAEESNVHKTGH